MNLFKGVMKGIVMGNDNNQSNNASYEVSNMERNVLKKRKNVDEDHAGESFYIATQGDTPDGPKKWILTGKKHWSLKKKIIVSCAAVLSALIAGLVIYFLPCLINPVGQFNTIAEQISSQPKISQAPSSGQANTEVTEGGAAPSQSATLDPYGQLVQQGDFSILKNTVNILLIGVDDSPERLMPAWIKQGGKSGSDAFHSDVMIVLSINKENNQVSLISLPRDTYAKIPDYTGIYKLNASINCGGGWPTPAGCEEVCKAASWMIGGLPVDYYYAVDMSAVKGLVDAIGGVDFNIDITFTINNRSYTPGMQHMNGQAVLDYLRVRKEKTGSREGITGSGGTGDLNRINRQKNMLIAIFKKIKATELITQIPGIIGAFNGDLVTNVSLAQTAALAAFSKNIDADNVKMYSMDGSYYDFFNDNFVITDQNERRQIIKDVYGVDIVNDKQAVKNKYGVTVPSYNNYSLESACMLWDEMQIEVTGNAARSVLGKVKGILDADALLPPQPTPSPTETVTGSPDATPSSTKQISTNGDYRKYPADGSVWAIYNKAETEYSALIAWKISKGQSESQLRNLYVLFGKNIGQFQTDIKSLCSTFSMTVPKWYVIYMGSGINQSYVKNQVVVDVR